MRRATCLVHALMLQRHAQTAHVHACRAAAVARRAGVHPLPGSGQQLLAHRSHIPQQLLPAGPAGRHRRVAVALRWVQHGRVDASA